MAAYWPPSVVPPRWRAIHNHHCSSMTIRARKRFGQHFLHDTRVIEKIIDRIDCTAERTLIEIGPGTGALTGPLLARVPKLHVIEIDRDLAQRLETRYAAEGKLVVHCEDVLQIDFCNRFPGTLTVIGNLPYNISTPLMFHLLEHSACIGQMIFMVQKEVAVRLCAEPGSGDYGRLSIMVQAVCQVDYLFSVGAGSFNPPPRVESAVIRLLPQPLHGAQIHDRKLFNDLVRTAFSKRRKTIRNALKSLVTETSLHTAGILPESRPEEIAVQTWIELANIVYGVRSEE